MARTKPGYVRSLSYDPVEFGQECGRANPLLLSLNSNVCSCQSQLQNSKGQGKSENKKFTPEGEGGSGRQASATENT